MECKPNRPFYLTRIGSSVGVSMGLGDLVKLAPSHCAMQ